MSHPITYSVLAVDDSPANLNLLANLLRDKYQIRVANNGQKALDLATVEQPDLILLDVMMPGMDGFETLRRLKSEDTLKHIPVIMISAKEELMIIASCIEMGAEDYIQKPFDPVLLTTRVNACMERKILRNQELTRSAELAEKNEQLRIAGNRVRHEIQLARNMQVAILQQTFPNNTALSIHACMIPALELSGDFYDCFSIDENRYGVLVADVSGKGVEAAFFMAVAHTVILNTAMKDDQPSEILARVNNFLCQRNPMNMFVTACYAIYNQPDGTLIYANAGHLPPLLRRNNGLVEVLPSSHDIALGIMSDVNYATHHIKMAHSDTLLLYTDGISEAISTDGETFGETRLLNWLASADLDNNDAAHLVTGLVNQVTQFVNGAEASDDITCLILCRKN